jgi:hypothetical protein
VSCALVARSKGDSHNGHVTYTTVKPDLPSSGKTLFLKENPVSESETITPLDTREAIYLSVLTKRRTD